VRALPLTRAAMEGAAKARGGMSRLKSMGRIRVVQPRVRLETMGSFPTRCLILTVYIVGLVALALVLTAQFAGANLAVEMASHPCSSPPWPFADSRPLPGGVNGSSCFFLEPSDNATTWLAYLTGFSRLDGNFRVSLKLASPVPSGGTLHQTFSAVLMGSNTTAVPFAAEGASSEWLGFPVAPNSFLPVISVWNQSVASGTSCPPGGPTSHCQQPLVVLDQASLIGTSGPANVHSVLVGVQVSGVPRELLQGVGMNSTLVVGWTAAAAEATDLALRLVLFPVTAVVFVAMSCATAAAPPIPPPPGSSRLFGCHSCRENRFAPYLPCFALCDVPQRGLVLLLLVGTLLWQNPLGMSALLPGSEPTPGTVLPQRALTSLGWAIMLGASLGLVESIRSSAVRVRDSRESLSCWDGWRVVLVVLWAIVTFVSSFGLSLLAEPAAVFRFSTVTSPFGPGLSLETGVDLALACGVVYTCMLLLYLMLQFWITCLAGGILRQLPYAETRFYQLVWRLFVWLQLVVVSFIALQNSIPLVVSLADTQSGSLPSPGDHSDRNRLLAVLQILRNLFVGMQPSGELLLVTTYAIILAYAFLPPQGLCPTQCCCLALVPRCSARRTPSAPATEGPGSHVVMPREDVLEATVSQFAAVVGLSSGAGSHAPALFSLSTACWLFDLAWVAYKDSVARSAKAALGQTDSPLLAASAGAAAKAADDDDGEGSSVTPTREVLHGFEMEAVIENAAMDIRAFVMRRGWRVVVSFRGSASRTNLRTDFNAGRSGTDLHGRVASLGAQVPGVQNAFPLVHIGFHDAYSSVREALRSAVQSALAAAGPGCRLYVTGHSLGGALATLASLDLVSEVAASRTAHRAVSTMMRGVGPIFSLRTLPPMSPAFDHLPDGSIATSMKVPLLRSSSEPVRATVSHGKSMQEAEVGVDSDDPWIGSIRPDMAERDEFDPRGEFHSHDANRGRSGLLSRVLGKGLPGAGDAVVLMTFGSPRVGNAGFVRVFNAAVPLSWRVEMERDLVTTVPKFCCLYKHAGTRVLLDEVGNVIVDPGPLELSLRVRSRTSVSSHLMSAYRAALIEAQRLEGIIARKE
jgi:hypothetical protein